VLRFFISTRTNKRGERLFYEKIGIAMLMLIIITVGLIGVCVLGFGVKIFFHHSHQFPETSAGHSPELRKCGIRCPHAEEEEAKKECTSCTD